MTIYDDIGGAEAVAAAVDDFYRRVLDDELLAPWFAGVEVPRLKAHQRAFITAAIGGPDEYSGRSMADAHAGLAITPEAFGRVVDHLVATLLGLGVPDDVIGTIGATLFPLEAQIVSARTPTASSDTAP
jgi:hemoglobin